MEKSGIDREVSQPIRMSGQQSAVGRHNDLEADLGAHNLAGYRECFP